MRKDVVLQVLSMSCLCLAFALEVKGWGGQCDSPGVGASAFDAMSGVVGKVGWAGGFGRLISRRQRQAFVCAVGGPVRAGGKLGCAVVRHS